MLPIIDGRTLHFPMPYTSEIGCFGGRQALLVARSSRITLVLAQMTTAYLVVMRSCRHLDGMYARMTMTTQMITNHSQRPCAFFAPRKNQPVSQKATSAPMTAATRKYVIESPRYMVGTGYVGCCLLVVGGSVPRDKISRFFRGSRN